MPAASSNELRFQARRAPEPTSHIHGEAGPQNRSHIAFSAKLIDKAAVGLRHRFRSHVTATARRAVAPDFAFRCGAGRLRCRRDFATRTSPAARQAARRKPPPATGYRPRRRAWFAASCRCRSACRAHRANSVRPGAGGAQWRAYRRRGRSSGLSRRPVQLVIQKHDVELGVMNDERVIADERQKIAHDIAKQRFADKELGRNAVNASGLRPGRRARD